MRVINYSQRRCAACGENYTPRGSTDPCCSPDCRLAYYVERKGEDECWPWRGAIHRKGYAIMRWEGKAVRVHRLIYRLKLGWVPPDMIARHTCDNRWCCNPKHIVAGSPYSNSRDMVNRGRSRNQFTAKKFGYVSFEQIGA